MLPAPLRERAHRRRLLTALAWSVGLHAAVAVGWPRDGLPEPPRPPAITLYTPEVLTVESVAPSPGGGGGSVPPASATPPAAPPAAAPSPDYAGPVIPLPVQMAPEPPRPAAPAPRTELIPPDERPLLPPDAYASGPPATTAGTGAGTGAGTTSGDGSGPGTGGGDGAGDGTGTGDGAGDGAPAPLVREPDRTPFPTRFAEPAYPEEARRARVRARVRVEVLVDEAGRVTDARVVERLLLRRGREDPVSQLPYGLDAAALAAARRCEFRPARHDGRPVRTYYTIPYSFGV